MIDEVTATEVLIFFFFFKREEIYYYSSLSESFPPNIYSYFGSEGAELHLILFTIHKIIKVKKIKNGCCVYVFFFSARFHHKYFLISGKGVDFLFHFPLVLYQQKSSFSSLYIPTTISIENESTLCILQVHQSLCKLYYCLNFSLAFSTLNIFH